MRNIILLFFVLDKSLGEKTSQFDVSTAYKLL